MKKWTLLLLFVLLLAGNVHSQKAKFGAFVDPMITWLSPDTRDVISGGVSMGVNGGLAIDNYFQKNYAVHTGISIGTQAGSLKFGKESYINAYNETDTIPPGTTVDYRMNYITIPLGLKLKSNQIGYFSYYALLGFTNQFNIKAHGTSDDGTLEKSDIIKEINLYNLAYHFGAGIEYAISQDTALDFGVVYHNGFLDVTHNSNAKVYFRMLSFRLGVMF